MTGYSQSHKPLPRLIAELNRHLKGWGNYFSFGYPRRAYGEINNFVLQPSLSPRGTAKPATLPPTRKGKPTTQHFQRMGLQLLTSSVSRLRLPAVGDFRESRMREICTSGSTRGEWVAPLAGSPSLLLYRLFQSPSQPVHCAAMRKDR